MIDDLNSLLKKIRQGDESAFNALSKDYKSLIDNAVRRFALSFKNGDNGSAELYGEDDLRQYATIALFRAAVTYRPDDEGKNVSFGLYAKICINNALISELRKYKSELRRIEAAKKAQHTAKRQTDPLQQLVYKEEAGELLSKIGNVLSSYEKEIFDCYIEGKSVREIAERLGKEEKSVSNALYRVKVKIRGLLKIQ